MNLNPALRTQIIHMMIAFAIGAFVVIPDIFMLIEKSMPESRTGWEEPHFKSMPPPNHGDSPLPEFGPEPPGNPERMNKPFDGAPGQGKEVLLDAVFYILLAWALLWLNNTSGNNKRESKLIRSSRLHNGIMIAVTFLLCILGIFINSLIHPPLMPHRNPFPWFLDGRMLFKGLFVFISVVFTDQLFKQLARRQYMSLENERLKNENLENRFEALAAQVSPHFFFNALNSLSGLIRAKENKKALKYINEISNLFRFILQEKWQELVPLKEELKFLDSYRYLLKIKYEDRLQFRLELDKKANDHLLLPAMSLQPLAENIIKHNIISEEMPMLIRIHIREGNVLVMENDYQPIERSIDGTGTGLRNLENRYKYLAGKSIHSYIYQGKFLVELPLIETSTRDEGTDY